jgi:hypothetical protein
MRAIVYARILGFNILLFIMATPCFVFGQAQALDSIQEVEVCQVLNDPGAFDGRKLRFRGRLEFEFEGHHVSDADCGLPLVHIGIWWAYGGEPWLAPQADTKRIQALTSQVLKNADFDNLHALVHAHRALRPDGEICGSHRACAYYDVVATYTGRFFAGRMRQGRTLTNGFGHMGCCHLFVIERVSEVVARRTSVPDDGLKFSCASTSWQSEYPAVPAENRDARLAANKQFLLDQLRPHGDESMIQTIESDSPWHYLGLTGYLVLSSADLLTTYTAQFPNSPHPEKAKKNHLSATAAPIIVNVTRERCEQVLD